MKSTQSLSLELPAGMTLADAEAETRLRWAESIRLPGETQVAMASRLGVSQRTIMRWLQRDGKGKVQSKSLSARRLPLPLAIEFNAGVIAQLTGPLVYVFFEGSRATYAGSSRHGLIRALSTQHHRAILRTRASSVKIYPCSDLPTARRLEAQLIADYRIGRNTLKAQPLSN